MRNEKSVLCEIINLHFGKRKIWFFFFWQNAARHMLETQRNALNMSSRSTKNLSWPRSRRPRQKTEISFLKQEKVRRSFFYNNRLANTSPNVPHLTDLVSFRFVKYNFAKKYKGSISNHETHEGK